MRTQAVWTLRVLWFLLPLTVGQAVSDAPTVFTTGVAVVLWVVWAFGLIASVLPHPVSLTALRTIAPGALAMAVWALFDSGSSDTVLSGIAIVGVTHAAVTVAVAFNQLIGDRFVDGASYGDERRLLLRPPPQLGYMYAPLAWLVMAAASTAGVLLLSDRRWLLGAIVSLLAIAMSAVGGRALHQLTQRWIVFVPTGMVLHDLHALTEPVLFRRTAIERLGAAIAGTPARDLSNGAAGLLVECELTDPAPLGLRDSTASTGATMTDVRRFLFTPTRPGALLDEAERRNIAVG